MEKQTLHELLDRLHEELRVAPPLDEGDRTLLHEVQADIRRLIEPAAGENVALTDSEQPQFSRSRLQEAALRFAVSHPKLANQLDGISNALSNAGL